MSRTGNGATPASNTTASGALPGSTALERVWLPPLPRRLSHLEPLYVATAAGLVADKGGTEAVTTGEMMLIADTAEAYVVGRMLGRRIFGRGVIRKAKNGDRAEALAPAVAAYFTAKNTVRLNLVALGLDRRARDVGALADYLASHAAAGQRGANGTGQDSTPEGDGDRRAEAVQDGEGA